MDALALGPHYAPNLLEELGLSVFCMGLGHCLSAVASASSQRPTPLRRKALYLEHAEPLAGRDHPWETKMDTTMTFGDILEAADQLSVDDQESLLDILHRRLIERRREGIARDIEEAHEALKAGKCRPATPDEIFNEIIS